MKNILLIIMTAVLIVLSCVFTACGGNSDKSTADSATSDSAKVSETTVVLETTGDGGTIEQDSEGNKIKKDENGKVVSVEDKNGSPVDVTEYLTTHKWVESNGDSGGSGSSSGSGNNSSGSSSGSGLSGNSGSSSSSGPSSGDDSEMVEESIPVVIATIPDEDDMIELPDI